ncbi:MAG: hypothetical protein MZV65_45785 [Chromatiales bacterium]|nr:hypothetical protein [Chromatiales bacterium]MCK7582203.1 hypothetical protein [Chromatiales bacterium]
MASSPLFQGLPVHVLMSGKATRDGAKQLEWAGATLEAAGFEATTALVSGDPERIIAAHGARAGASTC